MGLRFAGCVYNLPIKEKKKNELLSFLKSSNYDLETQELVVCQLPIN